MRSSRSNNHHGPGYSLFSKLLFFVAVALTLAIVSYRLTDYALEVRFAGTVVGNEVQISSEMGGKLLSIEVKPNSKVEKGQLLAEISDETLSVEIAAASDELRALGEVLEKARADTSALERQYSIREKAVEAEGEIAILDSEIASLAAEIEAASQNSAIAGDRLARAESLFAKQAMTRSQLEGHQLAVAEATRAFQEVEARRDQSLRRRDHLRRLIELYRDRLAQVERENNDRLSDLEIEVKKKSGELDSLRARRSAMRIYSDHSGIVSALSRSEGEVVSAGEPILILTTGDRLRVEVQIPADQRNALEPGDRVEILTHERDRVPLYGWVEGILPTLRTLSLSSVGMFEERLKIAIGVVVFENEEKAKAALLLGQEVQVRKGTGNPFSR
jgi:multidrug resistance efflux pump